MVGFGGLEKRGAFLVYTPFLLSARTSVQEGFWSWISGVTDNAVYPVMLLTYLQEVVPVFKGGWERM